MTHYIENKYDNTFFLRHIQIIGEKKNNNIDE